MRRMDICNRLRLWTHAPDAVPASDLMDEAAAEIERLRGHLEESEARASLLELSIRRLAEQDATLSVVGGNVTVQMDGDDTSDAGKSVETDIPPAWLQKPYWVDPPSGWRYGFPRLYDPAADGDMTAWMIANGYPEKLAREGLPCTFTAASDGETV